MSAPKLKNPTLNSLEANKDKVEIKSYQNKINELLKSKEMAKKAALIIEQMLREKKK